MDTPDPLDTVYQVVKSQIPPDTPIDQVRQQVVERCQPALPSDDIARIIKRFEAEWEGPRVNPPRLLVDWGELPQVGHQVRPDFSLVCPGYEACRPEIRVTIDRELDHNDPPLRRAQIEDPGLWSFQSPFRMTSDGLDCRPGQYVIEVDLSFHDVPAGAPRFYRCRIRLNVRDAGASDGGVLEIDGDGQSMVNLQGYNLKQFSKVILKGGDDSVINLQDVLGPASVDGDAVAAKKEVTTFEYQLKVDGEKQQRLPTIHATGGKRAYLDACGFFFEDGRRSLVFTRPRITFGRSRDNDVVIRFLPRSEEHDNFSRSISRTHCIAELTPEGIELQDESNRGMEVNYRVVQDREVISAAFAGDIVHLELGATGAVPQKFELEIALYGPDRRTNREELEYWDEMVGEVIRGRLSRLHRQAIDVGLDAARYERVTSLAGEESYVHLFREAFIGGSPAQSAIVLRESGPMVQARLLHIDRTFWLEPVVGSLPVRVDGTPVPPRSLVALSPGMTLEFGKELATFERPSQLYLD